MVWTIDYNGIKYFDGMKQINLYWPDAATLWNCRWIRILNNNGIVCGMDKT